MPTQLPFEYLDKVCFAGTRALWSSFAPTWRLALRGAISDSAVRRAMEWLVPRWPGAASRVVALNGPFERASRFAWELDEAPRLETMFSTLDLRDVSPEARDAREWALADRFLDLQHEAPLAITWVRTADDAGTLYLQQHHALADGRAFLSLCADAVLLLDASSKGLATPPPPTLAMTRRPEGEALSERGLSRALVFLRGAAHTFAEVVRGTVAPIAPLYCNTGTDWTGGNRTHFVVVPASTLEPWRAKRTQLGASTNDLLGGALSLALCRWSARYGVAPKHRHNLFMPVDARPRDAGFHSFANHLTSMQLPYDPARFTAPLELARHFSRAAAPLLRARLPWKKLLFEAFVANRVPMHLLRHTIFEKRQVLTNLSFSNLISLGTPGAGSDGRWRGHDFEVESLRITTPCLPPQAVNTTLVKYGDSLCFNFNFKPTAIDAAHVADLGAELRQALHEASTQVNSL